MQDDVASNETHVDRTIEPTACTPFVYIRSEDVTVATCVPLQATNAVQNAKIVGSNWQGGNKKTFTKLVTRLGSLSGAEAGKINVGAYKQVVCQMDWYTIRNDATDTFVVVPASVVAMASQLVAQVVIRPDIEILSTITTNYDINSNGELDVFNTNSPVPGVTNELFHIGLGTDMTNFVGKVIYVKSIRQHQMQGGVPVSTTIGGLCIGMVPEQCILLSTNLIEGREVSLTRSDMPTG